MKLRHRDPGGEARHIPVRPSGARPRSRIVHFNFHVFVGGPFRAARLATGTDVFSTICPPILAGACKEAANLSGPLAFSDSEI